jgi:hypothetical protein
MSVPNEHSVASWSILRSSQRAAVLDVRRGSVKQRGEVCHSRDSAPSRGYNREHFLMDGALPPAFGCPSVTSGDSSLGHLRSYELASWGRPGLLYLPAECSQILVVSDLDFA